MTADPSSRSADGLLDSIGAQEDDTDVKFSNSKPTSSESRIFSKQSSSDLGVKVECVPDDSTNRLNNSHEGLLSKTKNSNIQKVVDFNPLVPFELCHFISGYRFSSFWTR